MATITCPHCGKEMFDRLDTCPHCGGPVVSEALEKEIQEMTAQTYDEINKKEKKWLLLSVGIGIALGVYFFSQFSAVYNDFMHILSTVPPALFITYLVAATVYGCHSFHPIKRFAWAILLPVIGIVIAGIIGLYVGMIGGTIFWFPRALVRFFTKKPLLSEKDITKLMEKELI